MDGFQSLLGKTYNYLTGGSNQQQQLPQNLPMYNGWVPDTQPSNVAGSSAQLTPQAQQTVNNSTIGKLITGGTPTVPPQQVPPQQTPQQPNNDWMKAYRDSGWTDVNAMIADHNANPNKFATQQPQSTDWDAMYAPILKNYDEAESNAKNQSSLNEKLINESIADQQTQLDQFNQKSKTQFDQDTLTNDRNKQSAISQAVRYANSIAQKAQLLYGASGAGQAFSEMSAQELMKNIASIQQQAGDQFNKLWNHQNDVLFYIQDESGKLAKDKENQLLQEKQNYSAKLAEISNARAMTNLQKLQQMFQEASKYNDMKAQIDQYYQQRQIDLNIWKETNLADIKKGMSSLATSVPALSAITSTQNIGNIQQQGQQTNQPAYNPLAKTDDPYSQLNQFLA